MLLTSAEGDSILKDSGFSVRLSSGMLLLCEQIPMARAQLLAGLRFAI
jgi:hypothetical protein